jgi:hypothetical protein
MEKERRNINLIIFLHPFGSVIRIYDKNYHLSDLFYNHHSTQVQSVLKNIKTDGLKYIESEGLGLLQESVLHEPVEQALECCDTLYMDMDHDGLTTNLNSI